MSSGLLAEQEGNVLLSFNDGLYPLLYLYYGERRESEPCTTTLDSGGDLIDIVADDAEADVLRVLFNDPAECCLGLLGHHVGLVENNELKSFGEKCPCFRELFDLLSHDVNTTIVGSVQLGRGMSNEAKEGDKCIVPREFASGSLFRRCVVQLQGWSMSFLFQEVRRTKGEGDDSSR